MGNVLRHDLHPSFFCFFWDMCDLLFFSFVVIWHIIVIEKYVSLSLYIRFPHPSFLYLILFFY